MVNGRDPSLFAAVEHLRHVNIDLAVKDNMPDLLSDVVKKKRRRTELPKLKAPADVTDKPLPEDVVNRILQVVLALQHFNSSLVNFAATILQGSSAYPYISISLDIFCTSNHRVFKGLFSSLPAIKGFDMPFTIAVCTRLVNPLATRKGKFHVGIDDINQLLYMGNLPLPQAINLWASQLFT
ncbi:hypothetical protein Tco_0008491 [Tanacetum coccineum]